VIRRAEQAAVERCSPIGPRSTPPATARSLELMRAPRLPLAFPRILKVLPVIGRQIRWSAPHNRNSLRSRSS